MRHLSYADMQVKISKEKPPMVTAMRAAGVLKPAAKNQEGVGFVVRYVHISLPAVLMPRQAEQVRQLLSKLTRPGDVVLYSPESDLNTLIGFAERYGLIAMPYDKQNTVEKPDHHVVVLDSYDIDSSLHQVYDLHDARSSAGSRVICSLS